MDFSNHERLDARLRIVYLIVNIVPVDIPDLMLLNAAVAPVVDKT